MKKTYIFHLEWLQYMEEMTKDEKLLLYESISNYNLWKEVKIEWPIKYIRSRILKEMEEDNIAYLKTCERNYKNWEKWGRPKLQSQWKPKKPSGFSNNPLEPTKPERDNDNDILYKELFKEEYINKYWKNMLENFYEYWKAPLQKWVNKWKPLRTTKETWSIGWRLNTRHNNNFWNKTYTKQAPANAFTTEKDYEAWL